MPWEKEILVLIGDSQLSIKDLYQSLVKNGTKDFITEGHLSNFLKTRHELFRKTDTHVWSNLEDDQMSQLTEHHEVLQGYDQSETKARMVNRPGNNSCLSGSVN